jgi:hypothetical protein
MKSSSSDAELLAASRGIKDTYWPSFCGDRPRSWFRVVNGFFIMRQHTVNLLIKQEPELSPKLKPPFWPRQEA